MPSSLGTNQDLQLSLARTCAARAYCPHFGEVLAGCALRTSGGALHGGSSVGTWSGFGGISPVTAALVALAGAGGAPADVVDAVWVAEQETPDVQKLREQDRVLLATLVPSSCLLG